jgi:hypothetical protein
LRVEFRRTASIFDTLLVWNDVTGFDFEEDVFADGTVVLNELDQRAHIWMLFWKRIVKARMIA